MHIENPLRLVRELKGAPLSILMALSLVKQRVTQEWLERATGYTDKPVSQALAYLAEIGMADHTSAGWQLVGDYQQLPLPIPMIAETQADEPALPEIPETAPVDEKLSTGAVDNFAPLTDVSRNNSDSLLLTYLLNTDSKDMDKQVSNNNAQGRKNSDSPGEFCDREAWHALTEAGVKGKKRQRLAAIVSAGEVLAWEAHLKREKGAQYKPGLLIYWLENGGKAPESPADEDDRSKYVSGKYADLIQH